MRCAVSAIGLLRRRNVFAARTGLAQGMAQAMAICVLSLCSVLLTQPATAQSALRAPLNIIPAPMQDAIGTPTIRARGSEKLAPRIAARQSKRAVRAVAAPPGTQSGIVQVGSLGTLQDAPVGLEAGFGSDLWRGARLAFIADQMDRLPQRIYLQRMRDMELTLHRGAASAPIGTVDGTSWYAARLNRFLALGDTGSVLALEGLTGAAKSDAYAAQALVKAHFGTGDIDAACALKRPSKRMTGYRDTLAFFMRVMVYCQLRAGEFEKVSLALDLNDKTLGADRLFRDMAYLMAAQVPPSFGTQAEAEAARKAGEEPPLVLPNELTVMQIMLLQLAAQPLPETVSKWPPFMAALLAMDYGQAPLVQLRAARLATLSGTRPDAFSQATQLVDITQWPDPYAPLPVAADGAEAGAQTQSAPAQDAAFFDAASLPREVFLAHSLRRVDMTPPAQQPAMIADVLRRALNRGVWRDMVRLLDDRLSLNLAANAEPIEAQPLSDADRAILLPALRYGGHSAPVARLLAERALTPEASRVMDFDQAPVLLDDLLAALQTTNTTNSLSASPDDRLAQEPLAPTGETGALSNESSTGGVLTDGASDAVLSDTPIDARPHPIVDFDAYEARLINADPPLKAFLRRELAVYHGLHFDLPQGLLSALALPAEDGTKTRLDRLADNKWVGDLLLALVAQYGSKPPAQLSATDISILLSSLRRVGLETAATQLGDEILTLAMAELSLAAPEKLFAGPKDYAAPFDAR